MSSMAMNRLQSFGFPGNVRQLENICHWLTVMAPAQQIALKDLPPEVLGASGAAAAGGVAAQLAGAPISAASLTNPVNRVELPQPSTDWEPDTAVSQEPSGEWLQGLGKQAQDLLAQGHNDVWDQLSQKFEAQLLRTALAATHGRRVEAANRLGIGRNTITRKLQELGLDNEEFD